MHRKHRNGVRKHITMLKIGKPLPTVCFHRENFLLLVKILHHTCLVFTIVPIHNRSIHRLASIELLSVRLFLDFVHHLAVPYRFVFGMSYVLCAFDAIRLIKETATITHIELTAPGLPLHPSCSYIRECPLINLPRTKLLESHKYTELDISCELKVSKKRYFPIHIWHRMLGRHSSSWLPMETNFGIGPKIRFLHFYREHL